MDKIRRLVTQDNRRSIRELSAQVKISSGSTHKILHDDLHMKKLAARFVPKILSDEQKARHAQVAQENLDRLGREPQLLRSIVTGDESWCYVYDPTTKQQGEAWLGRNDERPTKALRARSLKKVMLVAFFDDHSCMHFEFVCRTVNRYIYTCILGRLKEKIRKLRPGLWRPSQGRQHGVLLHYDNAPVHTVLHTHANLRASNIDTLPQPAYSPDMAPADYWFFPRVKKALRGWRFRNLDHLEQSVAQVIRMIPPSEFAAAIQQLPVRWQKCVDQGGDYFEGRHHLRAENPPVANP